MPRSSLCARTCLTSGADRKRQVPDRGGRPSELRGHAILHAITEANSAMRQSDGKGKGKVRTRASCRLHAKTATCRCTRGWNIRRCGGRARARAARAARPASSMGIIRSGIPIREAGLRRSAAGGLVGDTRIIQYAQAKAHAQLGGCREMHLRLRPGRGVRRRRCLALRRRQFSPLRCR